MNLYKEIFGAFSKADINYLIVGGVAVNLYGHSRFTGDIDILLALNKQNLKKMDTVMKKLDYVARIPVDIYELGDKKKLITFIKTKGMKAYTFISNTRPQLDIDIIVTESMAFRKFYSNKTILKVWRINLPVVSINDLIGMKKEIGREQDISDVKVLLRLKEL